MKTKVALISLVSCFVFAGFAVAGDHLAVHKVRASDAILGDMFITDYTANPECIVKGKGKRLLLPAEGLVSGAVNVNGIPSSPIVLDPAPQELTQVGYLCYKVKCPKPDPATASMDLVDEFVSRSASNDPPNPVRVYRQVIEICKPVNVAP